MFFFLTLNPPQVKAHDPAVGYTALSAWLPEYFIASYGARVL